MDDLTQQLFSIPKFGKGIGLHRMRILCEDVLTSEWSKGIDPINVVGSNGKGSTTMIISNILKELGLTAGQYTSPHLFEFAERISINNTHISQADLSHLTHQFFDKRDKLLSSHPEEQIGAFEAFTSIALSYFLQKKPDTIVLEAGIGGRYDSTRVMTGNFVAFTSLDLEHAHILGNSEELIAYDKIDIAKSGSTIIVGKIDSTVLRKLKHYAALKNLTLLSIDEHTTVEHIAFEKGKMILDMQVDEYQFNRLSSNLVGYHQVNNIQVAVLLVKRWLQQNYPNIPQQTFTDAVYQALENLSWTGRLEKVHADPSIFIDVGHTPQAIELLVKSFQEIKQAPCLVITGVSHDKEIKGIVSELLTIADAIVCTRAYHKGAASADIFQAASSVYSDKDTLFEFEKIEDSIDFSINYAREHGMEILIAGGLFLAIEAYHYLKGNDPAGLPFF